MQCFSTFVCACNDGVAPVTLNPLAKAPPAFYLIVYLSYLIVSPSTSRHWISAACLLGLGIGAGGREKHEDVVGLIGSFLRSAEETTAGSGA